jgi:hypothetical protein
MSKPAAIVLPLIALAMLAAFYVLPANSQIDNQKRAIPHYPKHAIQQKPIAPWPVPEFCTQDGRECVRVEPPIQREKRKDNAVDY